MELQHAEEAQVPQLPRHRPRQVVRREVQPIQVRQAAQPARNPTRQLVLVEVQPPEEAQVPQTRRERPGQVVRREVQPRQVRQVAHLARNPTRQLVLVEVEPPEEAQVPHARRNRPGQVVLLEVQPVEVRQAAQLGRNRPGQVVPAEVESNELPQVSQHGRDGAGEAVVRKRQFRDPAGGVVRLHPEPLIQGRRRGPVRAVDPACAVRRAVERHERRAVLLDALRGRLDGSAPRQHGGQRRYANDRGSRRAPGGSVVSTSLRTERNGQDPRDRFQLSFSFMYEASARADVEPGAEGRSSRSRSPRAPVRPSRAAPLRADGVSSPSSFASGFPARRAGVSASHPLNPPIDQGVRRTRIEQPTGAVHPCSPLDRARGRALPVRRPG